MNHSKITETRVVVMLPKSHWQLGFVKSSKNQLDQMINTKKLQVYLDSGECRNFQKREVQVLGVSELFELQFLVQSAVQQVLQQRF